MANPLLAGLLVAATLLPPQGQQDTVPTELRAAAEELALGRVEEAIKLAERYTLRHGRDPRGFMILGDAHAAHMPTGRFRALESYRQAKQLLPHDPEPPYRIALMGLWLGGDDGERIASEGLERVIELDPLYRDAWDQWLPLYRNAGGRRKMIERLQANTNDPVVQLRIAQLLIEEERYADADHLLDIGLTQDSTGPGWNALRAESALESGDTLAGIVFYHRALRYAVRDSANVLWRQVVGIATPSELRAWWAGVPPEAKGTWLESFWARRNPNLFASTNHRIVEHFSRLRYARKHYPLLHPLVSYHRSSSARTLWRRVGATTSLQVWTTAESCTCASGHRTRRGWVGTIRSTRSATRTNWSGGGTPNGERCASSGRARSPRDCALRRRWSSGR